MVIYCLTDGKRPIKIHDSTCNTGITSDYRKLFHLYDWQQWHEVGTTALSLRGIFAKKPDQMDSAIADEVYWMANMVPNKHVEYQIHLSNAETEATSWSITDMHYITEYLVRERSSITSNIPKQFKNEWSIFSIQIEASRKCIIIYMLWEAVYPQAIYFSYPMTHLVNNISDSIMWMGTGDNCIPDISKQLYISNVKEVYWSSNIVNSLLHILKINNQYTCLDCLGKTQSYIVHHGF